ncbi:MAG: acyltransferase [Bacillota bacterium]|nr:acyltransferase [Bacillota bacterium]
MISLLKAMYNKYFFSIGKLRGRFWSLFINSGKDLTIMENCKILSPEKIVTGNHVFINHNAVLAASGGISIGNYVILAPYVSLLTNNHRYDQVDNPIDFQGYITKEIIIEDDVWVGLGSIILPGVKLSRGCIIGAGSVVTKDVPSYAIYAGNPAKLIKMRFNQELEKKAKLTDFNKEFSRNE